MCGSGSGGNPLSKLVKEVENTVKDVANNPTIKRTAEIAEKSLKHAARHEVNNFTDVAKVMNGEMDPLEYAQRVIRTPVESMANTLSETLGQDKIFNTSYGDYDNSTYDDYGNLHDDDDSSSTSTSEAPGEDQEQETYGSLLAMRRMLEDGKGRRSTVLSGNQGRASVKKKALLGA